MALGDCRFDVLIRSREMSDLTTLPLETLPCELHTIEIGKLELQMVRDEDLRTKDGALLVAKGIEITETLLKRIQNFRQRGSVAGISADASGPDSGRRIPYPPRKAIIGT